MSFSVTLSFFMIYCLWEQINVLPHHCWPAVVLHMKYTKTFILLFAHCHFRLHWNFYQVMQTCANWTYYYTIFVTILKSSTDTNFSVISMQNALSNIVINTFNIFILTTQDQSSPSTSPFATFLRTRIQNRREKKTIKLRKTCVEQGSTFHLIVILV